MTKRRKIKRKVMAWLLAVVMVFTMTPSTVFAAEGNETEEHTHGTPWNTTGALPTESGTYYLTSDISLSSTCEIKSGTVNLCLNGHVIKGNCSNSMIKISSDATLNIYDCQTTEHKFTVSTKAAWTLSEDAGNRVIHGGVITGGNSACGSVIYNCGTFNMYGGNIVGNTSTETKKVAVKGGVIYNEGTITIYNDVKIMGNYGTGHGATIFNNGTFYNYGSITENVAVYSTVRNCSGTFYNGTADNHEDAIINQNLTYNVDEGTGVLLWE